MSTEMYSDAEGALARGEGGKSYLLGDQNVTVQEFLGAFFTGFGKPPPPLRDEPHPLCHERAVKTGDYIWYEPDVEEIRLLGCRRGGGLRAIAEEMIPLSKQRNGIL